MGRLVNVWVNIQAPMFTGKNSRLNRRITSRVNVVNMVNIFSALLRAISRRAEFLILGYPGTDATQGGEVREAWTACPLYRLSSSGETETAFEKKRGSKKRGTLSPLFAAILPTG
jgi:hypothetical protein